MQSAESAQSLRLSAIYDGGANSLRRPTNFVKRGRAEPETVDNFHHGAAQSLRRPTNFVKGGAQSLRLSAIFTMGVHKPETSPNFCEWKCTKMLRA